MTIVRLTPAGATLRRRVFEQRRRRLRAGAERVGLVEAIDGAPLARVVAAVGSTDPMLPPGPPVDRPVGTGRLGHPV